LKKHRLILYIETKELKRRVRDIIDPSRDLGHVDGKKCNPSFYFILLFSKRHYFPSSNLAPDCQAKNITNEPFLAIPSEPQEQTPESQNTSTNKPSSYMSNPPIPRAINRLQSLSVEESHPSAERKFTPMDVDVNSRPTSSKGEAGEGEALNSRGKIVITGDSEGGGYCLPGEDC
jgi:hypothetical protein